MGTLFVRTIGLSEEENEELRNVIHKWNLRRESQNKRKVSYWMQVDKKKRCSRDIWARLHQKN